MSAGADWEDHARIARKARLNRPRQEAIDAWRAAMRPRPEMDGNRNDTARRNALIDAAADEIFGGTGGRSE